jgi:preprotein translocase subunit SecF
MIGLAIVFGVASAVLFAVTIWLLTPKRRRNN